MKHLFVAVLTWCTVAGFALGAGPPQKKAAVPSSKSAPAVVQKAAAQKTFAQKSSPAKTVAKKGATPVRTPVANHPSTAASRTATQRSRYASYRRPVRRPTIQQSPTADRYREIQNALAAKGYLKTPPNGIWDKDSVEAMQQFQKDKNLEPTGKLTARSLGELGLGPKPQESALMAPASTASLSDSPGVEKGAPVQ